MSIGLNDLQPRRTAKAKTTATSGTTSGAKPQSTVTRPWTSTPADSSLGRMRKRPDQSDAVMNENWLNLHYALPFHFEFDESERAAKFQWGLQRRLRHFERRLYHLYQQPMKTLRAIRRFCRV